METIVYFIRHSEPLKLNSIDSNDSIQLQNEKKVLSVYGEVLADKLSNNKEFHNVSAIYSSNYVRTISTAKYLANKKNLEIIVYDNLGERKIGINSWEEYPSSFEIQQFEDENYKLNNGESQKETRERLYNTLISILNENKGRDIAIFCHSTAMMFLFKKWCNIKWESNYTFNNIVFFDGKWNYCQSFKLVFNDNNDLININQVKN